MPIEPIAAVASRLQHQKAQHGKDLKKVQQILDRHKLDKEFLDWVCNFVHWQLDDLPQAPLCRQ